MTKKTIVDPTIVFFVVISVTFTARPPDRQHRPEDLPGR